MFSKNWLASENVFFDNILNMIGWYNMTDLYHWNYPAGDICWTLK